MCHERYDLGGGDQTSDEFTEWCAPDSAIYAALKDGTATFDTLDTVFPDKKIIPIGSTPVAGSPAG